jgi:hypothetical protein
MNTNLKDKLGMYLKVQDNLKTHAEAYVSHPKMAAITKEFTARMDAIYDVASRFELDNTGVTEDKAFGRVRLQEQVYKLSRGLKSLAEDSPQKTLRNRVNFTLAELQQMRDADLLLKAMQVRQFAQPLLESLKEYRIQAADLELLDKLKDEFLHQIPNPKLENEARSIAGLELEQLFAETDLLLMRIDDYLDTYRFEQPLLWEAYQLARGIDHTGSRKMVKPLIYGGQVGPGQIREAVDMHDMRNSKLIVVNKGKIAFFVSLHNVNTAMGTNIIEVAPGISTGLLTSSLNPSADARYVMIQNKDLQQYANYEITLETLGTQ